MTVREYYELSVERGVISSLMFIGNRFSVQRVEGVMLISISACVPMHIQWMGSFIIRITFEHKLVEPFSHKLVEHEHKLVEPFSHTLVHANDTLPVIFNLHFAFSSSKCLCV